MKSVKTIPVPKNVLPTNLRKFLKSYPYLVVVGIPADDKGVLVDVNLPESARPHPSRISMATKAAGVIPRGMKASERFWLHVKQGDGCWPWQGKLSERGVGQFCLTPQKPMSAPRVAWTLTNGKPKVGEYVIRTCETSSCVRPDHLKLVNASEKQTLILAKARAAHAARHRINPATVMDIYKAGLKGEKLKDTSTRLGVSRYYVSRVQLGKLRQDVTRGLPIIEPRSWKLRGQDVVKIQSLLDKGIPGAKIASRFAVNPSVISRIKTGKRAGAAHGGQAVATH